MPLRNTYFVYGSVTKFFHWLLFILIAIMLVFGYFLGSFPKDVQPITYNVHKLIGLTILALMVLRLLWALSNPKPGMPLDTPTWQIVIERIMHWLLYGFLIAMPLAGWIGSVAMGRAPHWGEFQFTLPIEQNKEVAEIAFATHNTIAIILIVLISLHILAALYHYFIKKDLILQRMMPSKH